MSFCLSWFDFGVCGCAWELEREKIHLLMFPFPLHHEFGSGEIIETDISDGAFLFVSVASFFLPLRGKSPTEYPPEKEKEAH